MIIDLFEKLIYEHGSSALLKDQLNILRERITVVLSDKAAMEAECVALKAHAQELANEIRRQNEQIANLQNQLSTFHSTNPHNYCCDDCGSGNLKRTGNRTDPAFGVLGIKQTVFTCTDCGMESVFTAT